MTGIEITEPGVYSLPFEDYLRDPVPGGSLSNSGIKTLLSYPPAVFAYERDHGRPDKEAFDVGHAAHHAVLGDGVTIAVIPDSALGANGTTNTKASKEFIAAARARGEVPIKSDVAAQVDAMASALRQHPIAGKLLDPESGQIEQSGFWRDPETGIWMRCRYDYMRPGSRLILADYKSADSLDDHALANAIGRYGYDTQDAVYTDGARQLDLDDNAGFLFVFQAKTPPYLVRVIELPEPWKRIGRERTRRAIETYVRCSESGEWPGYPNEIETLDPPIWVERQAEAEALA